MSAAPECLCAGIVVADHVCSPIARFPDPGELVTTDHLELTVGGCAANTAVDLVKLEVDTTLAGTVGNDPLGRFVRSFLEDARVDCSGLATTDECETSGTLIVNIQGEDRRFIHSIGTNAAFDGTGIDSDLVGGCKVLYLGGYLLSESLTPENVAALFSQARAAGATTVLDVVIPAPGDYWDRLTPVLPLTDVFLPNDSEAAVLTGERAPLQQALKLREAGAGTVGITCGEQGAVFVSETECLQSQTYEIDVVDGTGSGDAFVAGFIYGILKDADLRGCITYGSALGASAVRATGATTGVFDRQALEQFIAENPLAIQPLEIG